MSSGDKNAPGKEDKDHAGGAPRPDSGAARVPQQPSRKRPRRRWARLRRCLARRHELVKDYVQVFAILVAAFWAIWVFTYENIIKPRQEKPNVVVSTSLEEGGRDNGLIAIKATATVRSVGKRRAAILGAWFNVEGVHLTPKQGPAADAYRESVARQLGKRRPEDNSEIDMHASRYSDYDEDNSLNKTYIFSTNFLLNRSTLNPDEDETKVVTFHVPDKGFDLVRVILHVIYASDHSPFRPEWFADADGQLKLRVYVKACDGCPEEEYNAAAHQSIRQQYELSHVQSVIDLPLWGQMASPPNRQSDPAVLPPAPVLSESK